MKCLNRHHSSMVMQISTVTQWGGGRCTDGNRQKREMLCIWTGMWVMKVYSSVKKASNWTLQICAFPSL